MLVKKQKATKQKKDTNDVYKATKQLRDQLGIIWLTMIGYIVWVEFFKEVL